MNPGMMMLMLSRTRDEGARSYESRESPRMGYGETGGGYEVDSRFRDRNGREHYDNGRFAPMRNVYDADSISHEPQSRRRYQTRGDAMEMRYPYLPPVYERTEGGDMRMNQIGFAAEMPSHRQELADGYRANAGYHSPDEMAYMSGGMENGHGESRAIPPFTREMAEQWTRKLHNEDGSTGPHWTMEQTNQAMARINCNCDQVEFWAVMNALYSDYSKTAKKHNVNTVDFYADMAKAWLEDSDAVHGKASAYFMYIVK